MTADKARRDQRRRDWFDRGVLAINHSMRVENIDGPPLDGCYPCPLCGRFFYPDALSVGEITGEHVPPDSIGGREVVLTCRACNNGAGHSVDGHVAAESRFRLAITGNGDPVKIAFEDGLPGLLEITPDAFHLKLDKARANPVVFDRFFASLKSAAASGSLPDASDLFSIQVPIPFEERRVLLGYLRTAYLVAFAHWGYRMVFGEAFTVVRRQLRDWNVDVMPSCPVAQQPGTRLGLATGQHPTIGAVVLVTFKGWHVLLPGHPDDASWWDRFTEVVESEDESPPITIESRLSWPREPRHVVDQCWPVGPLEDQQLVDLFGDGGLVKA